MLQINLISVLSLVTASLAAPVADTTIRAEAKTLEAEDATLSGTEVLTELAGYSGESCILINRYRIKPRGSFILTLCHTLGSGYVGGFDESADKITFTIDSDALTLYDVSIRYAGIYGEKRTSLVLNGGSTSEVILPETTTWQSVSAGQVLLNEGSNTIDILNNWGW